MITYNNEGDYFRFRIENVTYLIAIREREYYSLQSHRLVSSYAFIFLNRRGASSFESRLSRKLNYYRSLHSFAEELAPDKLDKNLLFRTQFIDKSSAINFLYRLDHKYNPTPGLVLSKNFINLNYIV